MPGMFQTFLNPECLAELSLACLDSALDGASFPWGGNSKPICFRSSSFKGLKEQEMSSGNILINSLSSCGQWAGATCVIKAPSWPGKEDGTYTPWDASARNLSFLQLVPVSPETQMQQCSKTAPSP